MGDWVLPSTVGWRTGFHAACLYNNKICLVFIKGNGELCVGSFQCKSHCCQRDTGLSLARCASKGAERSSCSNHVGGQHYFHSLKLQRNNSNIQENMYRKKYLAFRSIIETWYLLLRLNFAKHDKLRHLWVTRDISIIIDFMTYWYRYFVV